MDKLVRKLKIGIGRDKAFKKFLNEINEWWPKEYTWSRDKLEEIKIDGRKDGLCTEIGPYGFRCDWGRVTELIESQKIGLKWQISANREPVPIPENGSDLEIVFKDNGNSSTAIEFEHRNFKNHGEGAEDYLKMMDSNKGWDYILDNFKKYCEN